VRLDELASRYEEFRESVPTLTCRFKYSPRVNLDQPFITYSDVESRYSHGTLNELWVMTGFGAMAPIYTHSDGVKHRGIDPDLRQFSYSDERTTVSFTVPTKSPETGLGGMVIEDEPPLSTCLSRKGRLLPKLSKPLSQCFLTRRADGHYLGSFVDPRGAPLVLEVAPEQDWMITSLTTGTISHPRTVVRITETQKVGNLLFPHRTEGEVYGKDGSLYASSSSVYDRPQVGSEVKLWMPHLVYQTNLVGSKGHQFTVDMHGKIVRSKLTRREPWSPNPYRLVQFASLVGVFASGTLLAARRMLRRRPQRTPAA
jgi:hypothetical protein